MKNGREEYSISAGEVFTRLVSTGGLYRIKLTRFSLKIVQRKREAGDTMRAVKIAGIFILIAIAVLLLSPFFIPLRPLSETVAESALADADSRFARIKGVNVHYKRMGSGEPVMILLHGFGASLFSWQAVMAPLAGYGTVIAYDRPAFGLTQRLLPGEWGAENPYGRDFQVKLLIGLMDALGIERAILIGHSAGGTVSLETALAYPERISGLVLVDAAVYSSGGAPVWIRPLLQLPQYDRVGPVLVRGLMKHFGLQLIEKAWHDPSRVSASVLEGYRKPFRAHHWDQALWQLTRVSEESRFGERLDTLSLPALVLSGDDDRIIPLEQSGRLSKAIADAECRVFDACGHIPQEECPDQFLLAVTPFVSRLRRT